MEKTGRCAIASWAARGKQYLVLCARSRVA
jgi:hypothetical protein